MDAITICAGNYLPFAHVLGESFLEHHKNSTFTILVIDAEKVNFEKKSKFIYISPRNLDIPDSFFENMAFYYNVTELATSLKPSALKYLFSQGSEKIVYLDPDIQVFGCLEEIGAELDLHPIVLTPHTLNPVPEDNLRPSAAEILTSGTFNLGFIALSKSDEADSLLNWWENRLRFDSIANPIEGLFTDQRWIDLVPGFFPFGIIRHPGYNVAYWNLHERKVEIISQEILINSQPLKFFHFSGYSPDKPWILSKYVSNHPRVTISSNADLRIIFGTYGEKVQGEGWTEANSNSYGYQNFENGKSIPSGLRTLYRKHCIEVYKRGQISSPPANWVIWACSKSQESGKLSRLLFAIWGSRPDLIKKFPDAIGSQASEFIDWAQRHGVSEGVIDNEFLKIEGLDQTLAYKNSHLKGINIAGHLSAELGIGQSARLILAAAQATNLPINTLNTSRTLSRQLEKYSKTTVTSLYPVTISIINADHFHVWADDVGIELVQKTICIGVWAWETEDFPSTMHKALNFVDEIWAVSDFVKNSISKHTKKPIYVIPTPIIAPKASEKLDRRLLNLPIDRAFNLFIFDYLSVFNRKNPIGLVRAHVQAFPNEDGPILVIKSINSDFDNENCEKLKYSIANRKDIILIEEYLTREQLTALMNECQAYISLHRSEGYGLTIAEAMALGKPVIATGYSGNLDFMTTENSLLVPYKLTKVGNGSYPYDPESMWAEPDLNVAADYLKKLADEPTFAAEIGSLGQDYVLSKFTMERATNFVNWRVSLNSKITKRIKKSIKVKFDHLRNYLVRIIKATLNKRIA